jgi:hypothetical protein
MKYIISEHKLDRLIFEFIDDFLKKHRQIIDSYIMYHQSGFYEHEHFEATIEYDHEDKRLYIDKNFVMLIANMFGLTPQPVSIKNLRLVYSNREYFSSVYVFTIFRRVLETKRPS